MEYLLFNNKEYTKESRLKLSWFFWHVRFNKKTICDVKKQKNRREKHAALNNTKRKKLRSEKGTKLKKMPTAVLRGDSQSGLAANAPIRSALSWPFYLSWSEFFWRVLDCGALLRACICQAPAKEPNLLLTMLFAWNSLLFLI